VNHFSRCILITVALQNQKRTTDIGQYVRHVETGEIRVAPNTGPPVEGRSSVVVVSGHTFHDLIPSAPSSIDSV
jgi:hypothetical protein